MHGATKTMKSTMGSATKALPTETIDYICDYLPGDSILSLRAVCRDTCQKVEGTFLTRFFTHRRQLISKSSLKQFLDISAHPVFCQKLKSVVFVRAELSPKWQPNYGPQANPNNIWEYGKNGGRATDVEEHIKRLRWLEEEEQMVDKWHIYEKDLGNLLDLKEITLALRNLKHAGITPALLVSGALWEPSPAHGTHELHRVLGLALEKHHPNGSHHDFFSYRPFPYLLGSGIDATKLLLKSIAQAEFPVQNLTMSTAQLPIRLAWLKFVDRPDLDAALHSNISNLRQLKLAVSGTIDQLDYHELAAFLAATPLLQSLSIDFESKDPFLPDGISTAFAKTRLKSLELTNGRFHREDLENLLLSQQSTLNDLTLMFVGFYDWYDSWEPTLEKLASGLNLARATLFLKQGRHELGRREEYHGTATVQAGWAELSEQSVKIASTESDSDGEEEFEDEYQGYGYSGYFDDSWGFQEWDDYAIHNDYGSGYEQSQMSTMSPDDDDS